MTRTYWYRDVFPFSAMVAAECTNVGLNTLFKAASSKGMSNYVFIFYSYAIATLLLLPLAIISHKKTLQLPPFNFSILSKIFLLGMIGLSAEMMSYKGIEYSSPTLASALSNLTAAFTFILAIIFRMERINLRSWSTGAKILGTLVSISGALVVILYKGKAIMFTSSPTNWVIGGLFLATEYLLFSIWNILQTQVLRTYPAELIVVFLYNLWATILSAPICLIAERKASAWRLRPDIALVAYVYSGFFGSSFSTVVHSWGLHLKGPVYVASFKPLSIAIAAAMGIIFLGDDLYLGSVMGVILISVGFYGVLWGKAKEEDRSEECGLSSIASSSSFKTHLLYEHKVEET